MIDLAGQKTSGFIPLKGIAGRQDISEKYLESIVKIPVQNGFPECLRVNRGGYRLAREPDSYTVGSMLRLMEGSLAPVSCHEQRAKPCSREAICPTLPVWRKLYEIVNEYFNGITLADPSHRTRPAA